MRQLSVAMLFWVSLTACVKDRNRSEPLLPPGAALLMDTGIIDAGWSKENILTIQATADPDNLHPCNGSSSLRSEILQLTQVFLISNKTGTELIPELLLSLPETDGDGKSYRYRLRKDIRWPDGTPITSEDVIFTCKVNASGLAENTSSLPYWTRLQDAKAVNPTDFTITMDARRTNDVAYLASFPILQRSHYDPQNRLAELDFKSLTNKDSLDSTLDPDIIAWFKNFNTGGTGTAANKFHCTGKYKVTEWESGRYLILELRDTTASNHPKRIIYRFNRDENTTLIGLHNQLYDLSPTVSSGSFKQALSDDALQKNYRMVMTPTYNYSYICFNVRPEESNRTPFFSNALTRKAMASAIPIDEIIHLVYGDDADKVPRMNSYVSPLKPDHDSSLIATKHDMAKARKLLSVAGWNDSDNDGILDRKTNSGATVSLEPEMLYLNASPDWKAIAELITSTLLKSGIKLNAVAVDPVTFTTKARNHDFDLLLGSWGGNALPEDPAQLWSRGSWSSNGSNYSGFGNDFTDSIIDAINRSENPIERKRLSFELQRSIYNEQPYVFLYNSMRRMIIHKRWSNVMIVPDRPGYQAEQWTLRKK